MLLQRLLTGNRIEKELALIFRLLRTPTEAARLRHVIAPLLVELRQLIELGLEILVRRGRLGLLWLVGVGFVRQLFQHRIGLHFLLNEVAQLEQRGLKNEETLLELRGKDLLQGKVLRLMHSLAGHVRAYQLRRREASNLRAVTSRPGRFGPQKRTAGTRLATA